MYGLEGLFQGLEEAKLVITAERDKVTQRQTQICNDLATLENRREALQEELDNTVLKIVGLNEAEAAIFQRVCDLKDIEKGEKEEKYPAPEFLGKFELPPDASEKVKHKEYGFWETRYQEPDRSEIPGTDKK